jgi:hypothetical protein
MFNKGQKVQVQPHNRTRHIFQNASVEPGRVTRYRGGQVGVVSDILDDTGQVTYVVKTENSYLEYSEDELRSTE